MTTHTLKTQLMEASRKAQHKGSALFISILDPLGKIVEVGVRFVLDDGVYVSCRNNGWKMDWENVNKRVLGWRVV